MEINKRGFAHPEVIIVVILMAIVGAGAFFLSRNSGNPIISQSSPSPEAMEEEDIAGWESYTGNSFKFSYPPDYVYLTYENGVTVFFDSQEKFDKCKEFQETQDLNLAQTCYQSVFTFSGSEKLSKDEYQIELSERSDSEIFVPETFTDSRNRVWKSYESLGEVYNFDSFVQDNEEYYGVHFQTKTSQKMFLNKILSTFEFIDPPLEDEFVGNIVTNYKDPNYNFKMVFPENTRLESNSTNYIRFQNYIPEGDIPGLGSGEFYVEIIVSNENEDNIDNCLNDTENPRMVDVGGQIAYRGIGSPGGDPGGIRFRICAESDNRIFTVTVTEDDEKGLIANIILDSFRFSQ